MIGAVSIEKVRGEITAFVGSGFRSCFGKKSAKKSGRRSARNVVYAFS